MGMQKISHLIFRSDVTSDTRVRHHYCIISNFNWIVGALRPKPPLSRWQADHNGRFSVFSVWRRSLQLTDLAYSSAGDHRISEQTHSKTNNNNTAMLCHISLEVTGAVWKNIHTVITLFLDVFSTLFFRYFLELCLVDINTVPTVLRKYDTIQTQIHHATKQPCMPLILCSAVEDPHLNLGL